MFQKTLLAVIMLFLFSSNAASQIKRDTESPIRERAQRIEPFIRESSKRYGIDPQLLRILCFIESRYRLDAVSSRGARGPMQFMPDTAKRFGLKNPHDPQQSIDAAARYLRDLLRTFGGRLDLALAAYNAGEGTVQSFRTGRPLVLASGKIINRRGRITGGIPPYRETQQYVRSAITFLTNGEVKPLPPTSLSLQGNSASLPLSSRNLKPNSAKRPTRSSLRGKEKESSLFIEVQ
ncbi:MAG TPA: lytic transglycosylase domain-containing protein [Pyrinomonadaceae bacterium]|nr:lytic transglycosylase domain-containing protein [Pyrinomonadaceae bacterium]